MQEQDPQYQLFKKDFDQYYAALCRYALAFVKDQHSCEDIVQEIFLKVWEKKQQLIGNEEIRFYLYRAVRNNCLTFLEKAQKQKEMIPDDSLFVQPEVDSTPHESANIIKLVQEAMNELPPRCREVFLLSRISGFTYQQIADTLGISVKTVENQMIKALKITRAFIRKTQIHILLWVFFFLFY